MDRIGKAYGAGLSGTASFDIATFIKRPQVILRFVSWVFSIVVFGCIASGAWIKKDRKDICVFNDSSGTCGFGTFIGVAAFLLCIAMLIVDANFDKISSVQLRKRVIIGDLAACGSLVLFWFITFCVLTNKWVNRAEMGKFNRNPPQAAIAFSFFSIFTWAGLLLFAFRRYKQGVDSAFAPNYDQDFSASGAPPFYPGVGGGGMDSYQEPPFTASNEAALPQYQQPAY